MKIAEERLEAWKRLRRMGRAEADEHAGGSQRRAQADPLVRGVLRHLTLLDALIGRAQLYQASRTPADLQWIIRLAAYEKVFQSGTPDYAIGAQAVALARQAGGERAGRFVNAVVRRLLPTLPEDEAALAVDPFVKDLPPATRWSVPEPILKRLHVGYGEPAFEQVLPVLAASEAPLWLRVNTLRTTPEACAEALAAEGVQVESPAPLPEALLWRGGTLPWKTEPWSRGELTVQDLGAMLATALAAPAPGEAVLDLCAAPGGKTGHLWQRMAGQGRLVACEVNPDRRRTLVETLGRLFPGHAIELPEVDAVDALAARDGFDCVLLDVPCLALGLIARHPEVRWDRRLDNESAIRATQRALLEAGASCVRPGGRLVWVTCSPTRDENEELVGAWLAEHPNFRLLAPAERLKPGWLPYLEIRDGWVRTRPDRIVCDGFAMAIMVRFSAPEN